MPEWKTGKDLKAELIKHQKMLEESAAERENSTLKWADRFRTFLEELREGTPEISSAAQNEIFTARQTRFEQIISLLWGTKIMSSEDRDFKAEVDRATAQGRRLGPIQMRSFPHTLGPYEQWHLDLSIYFHDRIGNVSLFGHGLVMKLSEFDSRGLDPKIMAGINKEISRPPMRMSYELSRQGYSRFNIRGS